MKINFCQQKKTVHGMCIGHFFKSLIQKAFCQQLAYVIFNLFHIRFFFSAYIAAHNALHCPNKA